MQWKKSILVVLLVIVPILSAKAQEILKAAAEGEMDTLKAIIESDSEQIGAIDGAGRAAIHFAANGGHTEIVKFLLVKGVEKDLRTRAGTTPLHYAALNGHMEIVRLLISEGANLEIKNTQTATPLYLAAMKGHNAVLQYLIEKGAVVDALDREEGTPLHAAAQSGHPETVKLLIQKGAEARKIDINGRSAMHFACQNGNREVIDLLGESGLTWEDPDLFGKTPLYYAATGGHQEAVDFIISHGSWRVSESGPDGNTYLHAAAAGGLKDFAEWLLSRGAKINARNIYGMTPLDRAEKHNHTEVAEWLIARNAVKSDQANPVLKGAYLGQTPPGMTPEIFAPGIISTEDFNERDVTFSRDGTEFYFSCWSAQTPFNIMCMKRVENQWTEPEQASFSGRYQDAEAYFTPDEQRLFFISNRPKIGSGNPETWEIWFVAREGNDWGAPVLLGSPFEGGFYTTFTRTWKMYYTQNGDLYSSLYSNGKFREPQRLEENVNSKDGEYNAFIAPDESYLIFTSIREQDNYGEGDLYICFHKEDGTWTEAINMGPEINSFARDYCPSVSPDGTYFFFSSRKYGNEDIFWVDARVIEILRPNE